jgi:putative addiction module CopG family antidote
MQFQIPPEFVEFVEGEIASGHFRSQEEVVLAGLSLLKQDREEAIAGIQQGVAEWKRGEGTSLDKAFAKIRSKHGVAEDT